MDGMSGDSESKIEKVEKEYDYRSAICKPKKWWRSTCLASGLALIWHSRLLSMVLSSAGRLQRGAEHCARRTWWQLVPIPILITMLM